MFQDSVIGNTWFSKISCFFLLKRKRKQYVISLVALAFLPSNFTVRFGLLCTYDPNFRLLLLISRFTILRRIELKGSKSHCSSESSRDLTIMLFSGSALTFSSHSKD